MSGHMERDKGEPLSIRQMVERMRQDHDIDPARVFITGLSAGGAMSVISLATYPEDYAGGGILAALPYKSAAGMDEAFAAMYRGRVKKPSAWGDLVRRASGHTGPWPRLSIWHGDADKTVAPVNAVELAKQWSDLHGIHWPAEGVPVEEDWVNGHRRTILRNALGSDVIEVFNIAGMAHGTPVHPGEEDHHLGTEGPYLLPVGIASSYHIARFWGLEPRPAMRTGRCVRVESRFTLRGSFHTAGVETLPIFTKPRVRVPAPGNWIDGTGRRQ
jgi:feruloyl esterase